MTFQWKVGWRFLDHKTLLEIHRKKMLWQSSKYWPVTGREGITWPPSPLILAFCPSKISCLVATVALLPRPYSSSIILLLFCHFALCLKSVITVFRHKSLLLRSWFVISQMELRATHPTHNNCFHQHTVHRFFDWVNTKLEHQITGSCD